MSLKIRPLAALYVGGGWYNAARGLISQEITGFSKQKSIIFNGYPSNNLDLLNFSVALNFRMKYWG